MVADSDGSAAVAPGHRDQSGAALPLVLVVVILLAAITIAVATLTTVGSKRSVAAGHNLLAVADAETVANWYVEELTYRRDPTCQVSSSTDQSVAVPAGLIDAGGTASLSCRLTGARDGYPTIDFHAIVDTHGQHAEVHGTVQVSTFEHRAAVLVWNAT